MGSGQNSEGRQRLQKQEEGHARERCCWDQCVASQQAWQCAQTVVLTEAVSRAELIRKAGLVGGPQTFCSGFEVLFAIAVTVSCVLTIRHLYKL